MIRDAPRATRTDTLFPYATLFRALYGFTSRDRARLLALFDTLLLAGADTDIAAASGVTPLLLLLGARAEPGTACDEDVVMAALDHLLDEEVSLDAQDPRGFGPLPLAALHGQPRMTQRSEESRVGQESVSTCRSRWSRNH